MYIYHLLKINGGPAAGCDRTENNKDVSEDVGVIEEFLTNKSFGLRN